MGWSGVGELQKSSARFGEDSKNSAILSVCTGPENKKYIKESVHICFQLVHIMTVNDNNSDSGIRGATRRRDVLTGIGAAGIGSLAGCADVVPFLGDDTYEIGMVDALTGSLADFGERNQNGVDLALEAVNEIGVRDGELEISVEDSQSSSDEGINAAEFLVNQENVPVLIGAVGSGVSIAIYEEIVEGTGTVQLSQNSTGLGLTDYPGLLRMSPSGRRQSVALADIIEDDGHDEVALTYINDDFGESLADVFVEEFNGEIVIEESHDGDQADYSGVLSQMNESGADAWLMITYQEEFATQISNMVESDYDPVLYGADSNRGDAPLETAPDGWLDGMKFVEPSAPLDSDNYIDFAERFEDEYGEEPTSWSAYAYDCVVTAAIAIEAADEFTGDAIGDVIRDITREPGETVTTYEAAHDILADGGSADDINYDGVSGPIEFDDNGDPVGNLQVFEVQDHEYDGIDFIEG